VEPLDVHLNVDDNLLAERAHGVVLEVQRVLVPLHVPFPWEHFVANITGKLAAFSFVDFGNVYSQVFSVPEEFITHAAHKFSWGRVNYRPILFRVC